MKIKTQFTVSTMVIVVFTLVLTLSSALLILNRGIEKQTRHLLKDLRAMSAHRIRSGSKFLHNALLSDIRQLTDITEHICKKRELRENIVNGQWKAISALLTTESKSADIDLMLLFDTNGKLIVSFPSSLDEDLAERHFNQLGIIKSFNAAVEANDLRNTTPLSVIEVWERETLQRFSLSGPMDSDAVVLAAAVVPNAFFDGPAGYIVSGMTGKRIREVFRSFFDISGQAAFLTHKGKMLVCPGIHENRDQEIEKKHVPVFEKSVLTQTDETLAPNAFVFNGQDYFFNPARLSDFFDETEVKTAIRVSDSARDVRIYVGEPTAHIIEAKNKIIAQGRQMQRDILLISLFIAGIVTAFSIVMVNTLSRKITGPIATAARASRRIASGELDLSLDESKRDETGMLARSMNLMIRELRSLTEENKNQLKAIKDRERRLRQSSKMESIGKLVGGIAHDFNNILGIIIGNVDLALMKIPDTHPAAGNIGDIKTAGLRARDIVRQLLTYCRQGTAELHPVDLVPVMREALRLVRSTTPAGIRIDEHINDPKAVVNADPTQIHQIMLNLCTNAVQAMTSEKGVVEVFLEAGHFDDPPFFQGKGTAVEKYLKLSVKDSGTGIAPQDLDKVFDPYFTTKEIGKGTGMGLSVVQGIVEAHKGHIEIESPAGEGTCVSVYLPVAPGKPAEEKQPREMLPAKEKKQILFIDDEEKIVKLALQTLTLSGYQVVAKTDPVAALEAFQSDPAGIDLVITDISMPRMNGVELAGKIKGIRKDIPVIMCTGYSALVNEKNMNETGISVLLMKPVLPEDLLSAIAGVFYPPSPV